MHARSEGSLSADVDLVSRAVGALPIVNHFLDRLRLDHFLERFVSRPDPRLRLPPAMGLGVLVRNVLVAREPLYGLSDWARRFDESLLGLPTQGVSLLNDDRVGRCLDVLFRADRAGLMTAVVVHAVRTFELDLGEIHNDSTTVTFCGEYVHAVGQEVLGQPTHRITHGYNKDHRPDLKQLLYVLTTTADGTVPVWCSIDHGNTTDEQTHIETWDTLRRLVGRPDFLYVADCKLCTKENMGHIAQQKGRFVTVLPRSRREDTWFRDWLQTHEVAWVELLRRKNSRRKDGPDEVYRGFESPVRSIEGYRILWIWSSQKCAKDRASRQERIDRAIHALESLRARINAPRSRLKTFAQVQAAAAAVLVDAQAERWLATEVRTINEPRYKQATAGRPSNNTRYVRYNRQRFDLHWSSQAAALQYDDRTDGMFPLILNDETLSLRDALLAYKHQPALEKRHEQFKSVLQVMPVLLKSAHRIEAFLFVYFLALLVEALIERAIRHKMKAEKIDSLPLYPEGRPCRAPTADRVFQILAEVRRHRLIASDQTVIRRFYDDLTPLQQTVLRLVGLSPASYFSAGEPSSR